MSAMIYPQDIVTRGSEQMLAKGVRVLQGNRLAFTELEHLRKLISYMDLNGEKSVADMGCGFGTVSLVMSPAIPRARFWLVNQNEFQLAHCPETAGFNRRCEDMTKTSIPDGSVDLVMFNYSLCHVDTLGALREAARIAKGRDGTPVPSAAGMRRARECDALPESAATGKLFVYDYARKSGDNRLSREYLFAHFISDALFREACASTGWRDVETICPGGDDTVFREAVGNDVLYDAIFEHLVPVIWRANRV
jgi:SAM-dependent methyltransferase